MRLKGRRSKVVPQYVIVVCTDLGHKYRNINYKYFILIGDIALTGFFIHMTTFQNRQ